MKRRGNKYGAITCRCNQGHVHDSRLEAGHCNIIHAMEGVVRVRTQVKYQLMCEGVHICNHYPDFVVEYDDGHEEIIESKGMETAIWRLKLKLFKANYPNLTYNVWKK